MKYLVVICVVTLIAAFYSCSDSGTAPNPPEEFNYSPLNVGDARQMTNLLDTTIVIKLEIIGDTARVDGQRAFIAEWTLRGSPFDTNYLFNKNGYQYSTELDTINIQSLKTINPFFEQRSSKAQPKVGESWFLLKGDKDSNVVSVHYLDSLETFCKTFHRVFALKLVNKFDYVLTTFYAPDVGWMGTAVNQKDTLLFSANYLKVGENTYGTLKEFKNVHITNYTITEMKEMIHSKLYPGKTIR